MGQGLTKSPLTLFSEHRLFTSAIFWVYTVQQGDHRRFSGRRGLLITVSAQLAGLIAHAELAGAISQTSPVTDNKVPVRGRQALPLARKPVLPGGLDYASCRLQSVPSRESIDRRAELKAFREALVNVRADIQQVVENSRRS